MMLVSNSQFVSLPGTSSILQFVWPGQAGQARQARRVPRKAVSKIESGSNGERGTSNCTARPIMLMMGDDLNGPNAGVFLPLFPQTTSVSDFVWGPFWVPGCAHSSESSPVTTVPQWCVPVSRWDHCRYG